MNSSKLVLLLALFVLGHSMPPAADAQEKVNPKTQPLIDSLLAILPEYEMAADALEKSVESLANSKARHVITALDCARLQILSIRSVRKIIADQPSYLQYHVGPANLSRWKEGAEYYLECARTGADPFAGMTNGVRPFRSKIDGQLLLYKFNLPKDYDSTKKYPLHVDLHAGGGFSWLAYWVTGKPDNSSRNATSDGAIHISPAGRQHIGMGEVAILDAIADAKTHLAIDDDRVVIGGASWGGTGGFHFATFLPDHFAAAHSLTGGGNYNLPVGNGGYDAYMLSDNLANIPFLLWDAPGDGHYKANHAFAEALRQHAQSHPGYYPHLELTDPKGQHGIIDPALRSEGWNWMSKQVRNVYPKRAIYKTHWLRYDGAYWARIDTMEDARSPRIDAHWNEGVCNVTIENADRFHLDFLADLVGSVKEVTVRINGTDAIAAPAGKTVYFKKSGGKWSLAAERYPPGLIKKHGLSGPIQDVFMEHPVLIVYGTAESREPAAVTAMLDKIVQRLISTGDGSGVLRTGFERKADSAISDLDLAEKNLILVGTPQQNCLLARIADKLPVSFLDNGIKIDGKEFRGTDIGLVLVYPNPLNPERYVLLLPESYEGGRPLDYPDYVVIQLPKESKGQSRIIAKGMFDSRWQER